MSKLSAVPFSSVKIDDRFWSPKLLANQEVTLRLCLDKCEQTGRIDNFAKAAGRMAGSFEGIYFNDSDIYKVLEGVAYSLMNNGNPELEERADSIIDLIVAAQQPDGYLDTYFTLEAPDRKWTDMEKHEDYCAGHLIEAAVAYWRATGKRKFLDAACRLADHIGSVFGPGRRHWVTGHEELELALVKLYQETGEARYLSLADWFLQERGHGHGRGMIWDTDGWGPRYCQDDRPVKEMTDISGHAVRAMYLYTGMADVAAETGDESWLPALERLWESIVMRNMYLTGGIGSSRHNEGFTEDYDLPNDTAYCETCAAVGMVYWNHRMNLMTGDGKYADVMERALYNGALAGVSLDGRSFFYVNPLSSHGSHHRQEWYDCSCCPTQIARFLPSVSGYLYAVTPDGLWVNLFVESRAEIEIAGQKAVVSQQTNYPWEGTMTLTFEQLQPARFTVYIRKPGWCRNAVVRVNGSVVSAGLHNGYLLVERQWEVCDTISVSYDMPVERNYAHPLVRADAGRAAVSRGPLVYCFEQCDNGGPVLDEPLGLDYRLETEWREDQLGGIHVVIARDAAGAKALTAVPYFAWDNREPGQMQVWMKEE